MILQLIITDFFEIKFVSFEFYNLLILNFIKLELIITHILQSIITYRKRLTKN